MKLTTPPSLIKKTNGLLQDNVAANAKVKRPKTMHQKSQELLAETWHKDAMWLCMTSPVHACRLLCLKWKGPIRANGLHFLFSLEICLFLIGKEYCSFR